MFQYFSTLINIFVVKRRITQTHTRAHTHKEDTHTHVHTMLPSERAVIVVGLQANWRSRRFANLCMYVFLHTFIDLSFFLFNWTRVFRFYCTISFIFSHKSATHDRKQQPIWATLNTKISAILFLSFVLIFSSLCVINFK